MKLLVVDDSRMARRLLIGLLRETGFQDADILQGEHGEEGVMLWREHHPDLIFLDLTMPVMDGFKALQAIRAHDLKTPILVVSADVQSRAVSRVMADGADGFIDKSALQNELEGHLRRLGFL